MATQVKHRRGSTSEIENFTPAIGELIVDTTNNDLVLGDGVEQGGKRIPTGGNASKVFDSISQITSSKTNVVVETKGRISAGDGGASKYLVVDSATYETLVGNANGPTALANGGDGTLAHFDVQLSSGLIAYKLKRDVVFTEQLCDLSDTADVAGAFVASAHASANHYHFPDVVTNSILIEGSAGCYIEGIGKLTAADNQALATMSIKDPTEKVHIKRIRIDANSTGHQAVAFRNDGAALAIRGAIKGFSVTHCELYNNYSGATLLIVDNAAAIDEFIYKSEIAYNKIYNAGQVGGPLLSDGIFSNSDNTAIHNNHISNCTDYFIALDYSRKIDVYANTGTNGLVAMGVLGVKSGNIYNNNFDSCGLGIALTLSGNPPTDQFTSSDIKIYDNTITNVTRDASGTPNGDAIFIDPSATNVQITGNRIDTAYRGIGCDAPDVICVGNIVKNTIDKGVFCSGVGSVVFANRTENTAGNYYGNWSDKIVVEGDVNAIVDISSFSGGWSNVGGIFRAAGYRTFYNGQKIVKLYGAVKGGTISAGQPIFQLPIGSRPPFVMRFPVADNTGLGVIAIGTDGNVTYQSGTGAEMNLDSIEFEAAD